jgi:tripartite-type tricarboxylate transporter receptor subunit TctC
MRVRVRLAWLVLLAQRSPYPAAASPPSVAVAPGAAGGADDAVARLQQLLGEERRRNGPLPSCCPLQVPT